MSEAELGRLRGTQQVYVRHITNSEREILALLTNFDIENEDLVVKLTAIKNRIKEKHEKIKDLDEKILLLLEQDESEAELDSIITRDDGLQLTFLKIERNLNKVNNTPSVHSLSLSNQGSSSQSDVPVNLPKLNIKKFNGDIINWQGFWDQFDSAINQKENISVIDKFNYLTSYLCDSAHSVISGLNLTAENYKEALELLHQRYGNQGHGVSFKVGGPKFLRVVKNITHFVWETKKIFNSLDALKVLLWLQS